MTGAFLFMVYSTRIHGIFKRIAAILHDVDEDSSITLEDLAEEGFAEEIIAAVSSLTKQKGETRIDAAHRAVANPIAKVVKLADNAENMDLSRIASPTEKDYARIEEYKFVRKILLGEI